MPKFHFAHILYIHPIFRYIPFTALDTTYFLIYHLLLTL